MAGNRRFTDSRGDGQENPLVVLGVLKTEVQFLKTTAARQDGKLDMIYGELQAQREARAAEDGQRKAFIKISRLGEIVLTLAATVATAWATVKASAPGAIAAASALSAKTAN